MANRVIARAHGKDRVIDFRDSLVAAAPEDYATMHQVGGRKNGNSYPSVIQMVLCDFSKGTGDKSVTVQVNLDPTLCYEWLEVCKRSLGQVAIPYYDKVPQQRGQPVLKKNAIASMADSLDAAGKAARAFEALVRGAMSVTANIVSGKANAGSKEAYAGYGTAMKNAAASFAPAKNQTPYLKVARGIDYAYTQDKVNVYKKGSDGFAPVSRLSITRQSFRKDGDAATYPWTFKVTNGLAQVVERDNGATTFRSDTLKNTTEVYIMVSDRDMFRMMTRVTHFIDAWENTYCIPVIRNGISQREKENNHNNSQQNGYNNH